MYKKISVFLGSIFVSQLAFSANPLVIPNGDFVIADKKTGCKIINPYPAPNESMSFTGKCVNGYANGFGTAHWYKDGKGNGTSDGYYEMGFNLNGYHRNPVLAESVTSNGCSLVLPFSTGSSELAKLFKVKFINDCHRSNQKNQIVKIFFNDQLFGTFEGTVRRRRLPVGGKLTLFTGSVYELGRDNGDYIVHEKFYKDWFGGLKRLDVADKGNSTYSEDDFLIKLGLNSSPTSARVGSADLWLFNLEMDETKNNVYLDYDIKPKHSISSNGLRMNVQVTIDYFEETIMGQMSVGDKKQFNRVVSIDLPKSTNFSAKDRISLTSFKTYLSGMGVDIKLSNFKSKVEVLSIDEL